MILWLWQQTYWFPAVIFLGGLAVVSWLFEKIVNEFTYLWLWIVRWFEDTIKGQKSNR
ncbi:MAG: hypothetical protein ABF695_01255 [Liquorilactobacillus ghanensis]|uniref:hypothetical protein n=1 Tax=Liquorilactobacillus ghanensis TaxID=399370 RepID=UPI0039EC4C3F